MRILFTATPGWGHIHPMVPLAKALAEQGDEILWATAPDAADRVRDAGFAVQPAGVSEREAFAVVSNDPEIMALPPETRAQKMGPKLFGTVRASQMLTQLQPIADDFAPDLLICDALELGGPIVAAARGIPNVTHSFGPLLPPERLVAMAAMVAPLWSGIGLEPRPYAGTYDYLYLDIYPPSLQPVERPHVPHTQLLRPVPFMTGADEALPNGLVDSGKPLVYITFGTVFSNLDAFTASVAAARELDVQVIATVGPHGDPDSLGPQPSNVHVARYIPQRQLLQHCAAVVSHAGSGSFLASLDAGVPHLCIPQGADQFLNAKAAAMSGTGLALGPDEVSQSAVGAALERLLSEPSFRAAAQSVREEICQMPTPTDVAEQLHETYG